MKPDGEPSDYSCRGGGKVAVLLAPGAGDDEDIRHCWIRNRNSRAVCRVVV